MTRTESNSFKQENFHTHENEFKDNSRNNTFDDFQEDLSKLAKKVAFLYIGSNMTRSLLQNLGSNFFKSSSLPVKVTYVDWWPRTCQEVKELGTKLWSRRAEGAAATAVSTCGLGAIWAYSDTHSRAQSLWDVIMRATQSFLSCFGFTDGLGLGSADPLWAIPSLIGTGTSLSLGSYDVISKYHNRDKDLETKPIFNGQLQEELDDILSAVCSIKKDNGFFQNLLLYGPPGTGKTMISKWIAAHSNMNYIFMSGGDLLKIMNDGEGSNQRGAGAAVATLERVIEHATSLSTPTVIFIDEAEACLAKRDGDKKSQELVSLLNAFLELTGQPSSKMMLVLATNRSKDIDSAVLSRMDHKIYVGPPEFAERKGIIQGTLPILINSAEDQAYFTPSRIDHIAKQTEGFSGRDIFKLINRLKIEIQFRKNLSTDTIDKVIANVVKQEQQIEEQNDSKDRLQNNPFYSKENKQK